MTTGSIPRIQSRLNNGDFAPAFQAKDVLDRTVQVPDAKHSVLLSFFRNSACAMCNLRVHELIKQYPQYHQHGLEFVAVFESSADSIREYVGRQNAPFPIIADPTGYLYDLYHVEVSEEKVNATMTNEAIAQRIQQATALGFPLVQQEGANFFRIPSDFLIDAKGQIVTAFYAELVGEHLPFKVIDEYLAMV